MIPSDTQSTRVGSKRVLDAFALWTFSPTVALRVLASNLANQDYRSSTLYEDGLLRSLAETTASTYTNWQVRLELKL